MLDLLNKFCDASGISGFEQEVRQLIISEVKNSADEIFTDKLGNLIIFKKGTSKSDTKLLFSAHMDEVGIIIQHIEENGVLRFESVGISPQILPSKRVLIGKDKIHGIICSKPVHLLSDDEKKQAMKTEDLYIDIGADNKEQAENIVSVFDYAVFDSDFVIQDDFIKAKALDDRIGCAILCDLIKSELKYDTYFAFTAGEELGARGSEAVSNLIKPDICVVVECTTAADISGVPEKNRVCYLGKGVVVPFMDGATLYDKDLYRFVRELCIENSIKFQTKTYISGGTDAQLFQRQAKPAKVLGISLPCRYIHTGSCVGNVKDIEEMRKITELLAETLPEKGLCHA